MLIYVYLRNDLIKIDKLAYFVIVPTFLIGYLSKLVALRQSFNKSILKLKIKNFLEFFIKNFFKVKKDLGNVLKFVLFTYGLSPILSTLTESISSDTIYALVAFMLTVNLIFYDYDSSEATM